MNSSGLCFYRDTKRISLKLRKVCVMIILLKKSTHKISRCVPPTYLHVICSAEYSLATCLDNVYCCFAAISHIQLLRNIQRSMFTCMRLLKYLEIIFTYLGFEELHDILKHENVSDQ